MLSVVGLLVLPAAAATGQERPAATADATAASASSASEIDAAIDAAEGDLADAEDRLKKLQQHLAGASTRLEQAAKDFEDATVAADRARRRSVLISREVNRAEHELERDRQRLRNAARDAYKHGMGTDPLLATLSATADSNGPAELAHLQHGLESALGERADAVESLIARVEAVAELREQADQARQDRRRELAAAEDARAEAARLHAELETGLDTAVAQRAELAKLVEQLTGERQDLEEHDLGAGVLSGELVTVEGITVAAELGPPLEQLLADARDDGIELSGWGWRSTQRQAELRRINGCPDVATSPASACRVPTARPGSSQHESGLAVDFTWQGETLCYPLSASRCRGNKAFDWLAANAHRYGLQVLPSEAWHWSTTGR